MKNNRILIVNDLTSYGRVSTLAMLPIFAKYGLHPYVLPTAIVSNATEYGKPIIMDTNDFMRSSIIKWNKLGFKFDVISTGYINSNEEVDTIINLIDSQDNPFVLVDPIMADSGEIYEGIYEDVVNCNQRLAAYANILIPNLTEAEMLANMFLGQPVLKDNEYMELVSTLSKLCPNDIVISGCSSSDEQHFNLVYSSKEKTIEKLYYDYIPEHFVGTGDIFSAVILSEYLNKTPLSDAVNKAATFIQELIQDNMNNEDHYDIQVENSINKLSTL